MPKFRHLSLDDRITIQAEIEKGTSRAAAKKSRLAEMDETIRIEGVHKLSEGADGVPSQMEKSHGFPHRRISYAHPRKVGFEAFPENVKNRQKDIFVSLSFNRIYPAFLASEQPPSQRALRLGEECVP
jgi:hypothetical protein